MYKEVPRVHSKIRLQSTTCGTYLHTFDLVVSLNCQVGNTGDEETLERILLKCRAPNPTRETLMDYPEITYLLNKLTNMKHWVTARAAYNGHRSVGITHLEELVLIKLILILVQLSFYKLEKFREKVLPGLPPPQAHH